MAITHNGTNVMTVGASGDSLEDVTYTGGTLPASSGPTDDRIEQLDATHKVYLLYATRVEISAGATWVEKDLTILHNFNGTSPGAYYGVRWLNATTSQLLFGTLDDADPFKPVCTDGCFYIFDYTINGGSSNVGYGWGGTSGTSFQGTAEFIGGVFDAWELASSSTGGVFFYMPEDHMYMVGTNQYRWGGTRYYGSDFRVQEVHAMGSQRLGMSVLQSDDVVAIKGLGLYVSVQGYYFSSFQDADTTFYSVALRGNDPVGSDLELDGLDQDGFIFDSDGVASNEGSPTNSVKEITTYAISCIDEDGDAVDGVNVRVIRTEVDGVENSGNFQEEAIDSTYSDGIFRGEEDSTGTHTGSGGASVLTDSTASWTTDALIGMYVYNTTDSSYGRITDNTSTTVTATLIGGTDNDWDNGDAYTVNTPLVLDRRLWDSSGSEYYGGWYVLLRKYGYAFEEIAKEPEYGQDNGLVDVFIMKADSFVVDTAANVAAYTGISWNVSTKTITLTASRTVQELYDWCQYKSAEQAVMMSIDADYDTVTGVTVSPVTTQDGNVFIVESGWTVSGVGTHITLGGLILELANGDRYVTVELYGMVEGSSYIIHEDGEASTTYWASGIALEDGKYTTRYLWEGSNTTFDIIRVRIQGYSYFLTAATLTNAGLSVKAIQPDDIAYKYDQGRLKQRHFRWRDDDGSESAATWHQNEDTNHTGLAKLDNIRLRVQVEEINGKHNLSNPKLQYRVAGSTGVWEDVE